MLYKFSTTINIRKMSYFHDFPHIPGGRCHEIKKGTGTCATFLQADQIQKIAHLSPFVPFNNQEEDGSGRPDCCVSR